MTVFMAGEISQDLGLFAIYTVSICLSDTFIQQIELLIEFFRHRNAFAMDRQCANQTRKQSFSQSTTFTFHCTPMRNVV